MSKKRRGLTTITDNRTYNILYKNSIHTYCFICQRRVGSYFADCSPSGYNSKGIHGSGKYLYSTKFRSYKTWKHNRRTQWKEST
jgi:hypothetical protein